MKDLLRARKVVLASAFSLAFLFLTLWNVLLVFILVTKIHLNDFGKFYYSAAGFLKNGDLYGPGPATTFLFSPLLAQHFWNLNPPHFHLLLLPMTYLSPSIAFAIWGAASLGALLASLRIILNELGLTVTRAQGALLILGFLAFSGTGCILLSGQLTFLLLFPITLAWARARQERWTEMGAYLGLAISIKLFLLIFLPYLIFRRHFQAAAMALSTTAFIYALGIWLFGQDAYESWIEVLRQVDWHSQSHNASLLGFLSRAFAENPLFAPLTVIDNITLPWLIASALVAILTLVATTTDSSDSSVDRSFALLLISALLISPLGWIYYLFLPLGPFIALFQSRLNNQKQRKKEGRPEFVYTRDLPLLLAIPGLLLPTQASILFQPHPVATLLIASIYFWSMFCLWSFLIRDWHLNHTQTISLIWKDSQLEHERRVQEQPGGLHVHSSR